MERKRPVSPQPRLRILLGEAVAVGPGKADLLEAIGRTGSISAAGREMGMSYRRAWLLVEALNDSFVEPLVISKRGGPAGGGAELTPFGEDVLRRYREMEATAAKSVASQLQSFRRLMSKRAPRDHTE